MPRTSFFMLFGAIALGIVAVLMARFYLVRPSLPPQAAAAAVAQTVPVVVATAPLAFADKLTADKLKLVQFPVGSVPAGAFTTIAAVVGDGERTAMRGIEPNEPLLPKSISGKGGRLSASGLIGANMRAIAVPVSDISGVGGFLASGDRVDVFITRVEKSTSPPFGDLQRTDILLQNVKVLAAGQDADEAKSKPEVVHTATLEVTPAQAQKVALAQTAGTLSLSLRGISDETRPNFGTVKLVDLKDGSAVAAPAVRRVRHFVRRRGPAAAPGEQIEVVRGGTRTSYQVPQAG